jgi:hypothetical protein
MWPYNGSSTTVWAWVLISSTITVSSGTVWKTPLSVVWQLEDLDLFPTDYASSLASQLRVTWFATRTSSPDSISTQRNSNTTSTAATSGLSTGAKIGIGVGTFAGALVLLIIAIYALLRRRKNKRLNENIQPTPMPAEMQDQDADLAERKRFIDGRWRSEVHAEHEIRELDSRGVRVVPGPPVELEGAGRIGGR